MKVTYIKEFLQEGLEFARCLGSKTAYRDMFPDDFIVFNCRIYLRKVFFTKTEKIQDFFKGQEDEIWYGDINFSKDIAKLKRVANKIGSIAITAESGKLLMIIGDGQ